jgi:hypothetical protein
LPGPEDWQQAVEKPLVDAMQRENRFESAAYTAVREHFESIFNAAARRQSVFSTAY